MSKLMNLGRSVLFLSLIGSSALSVTSASAQQKYKVYTPANQSQTVPQTQASKDPLIPPVLTTVPKPEETEDIIVCPKGDCIVKIYEAPKKPTKPSTQSGS